MEKVDVCTTNKIKITVLVENSVSFPFLPGNIQGLLGEHGFAVLIENGKEQILYDTGRGRTLIDNIEHSGIKIENINKVIISHGHLDHVGSLMSFLQKRADKTLIYCHPSIFEKKYNKKGNNMNFIGIPFSESELENAGGVFIYSKEIQEIGPGVIISGKVPRIHKWELDTDNFFIKKEGEVFIKDSFEDDQSVFIYCEAGIVIITGCGHAGIINIIEHAINYFGNKKILAIIGGLHLATASQKRIKLTIEHLKKFDIEKFILGHCTGFYAMCNLWRIYKNKVITLNVGKQITF